MSKSRSESLSNKPKLSFTVWTCRIRILYFGVENAFSTMLHCLKYVFAEINMMECFGRKSLRLLKFGLS